MSEKGDKQQPKRRKSIEGLDETGDDDVEYSNKDIMRFLRSMQKEGSDHSTHVEKKLDSVDKNVSSISAGLEKLQETVQKQDRRISELEHKISQMTARIIQTNNNLLQGKNVHRLANLIITGLPISKTSTKEEVSTAVSKFMSLVEVHSYQVVNYVIISWGQAHAVKCTFSPPSIAGQIIRNSNKLTQGEAKALKYGVVPDLSREQLDIKKKLTQYGKFLAEKHEVEYRLKSWRYLLVKLKSGSVIFFEADSTQEPARLDPKNLPPQLILPQGKQFFRTANSVSPKIVDPNDPGITTQAGAAGSQHNRTTGLSNSKERFNTHRKSLASKNNTQSQTAGGSQSSGFSQPSGTPQSQPSSLTDPFISFPYFNSRE